MDGREGLKNSSGGGYLNLDDSSMSSLEGDSAGQAEKEELELSLSKLFRKLESLRKDVNNDNKDHDKEVVSDLEEIHSEIVSVQGGVEQTKIFKKGEELWSKWLEVAMEAMKNSCTKKGDSFKEIADEDEVKMKNLISLAFNNRGYLKYLQVNFEGAIQDYSSSLNYNPNLPQAYYNRGLVTYRLAFFDQAVEDMEKAVQLDPSRTEFKEGLERVKEMLGSPKGHDFRLQFECHSSKNDS